MSPNHTFRNVGLQGRGETVGLQAIGTLLLIPAGSGASASLPPDSLSDDASPLEEEEEALLPELPLPPSELLEEEVVLVALVLLLLAYPRRRLRLGADGSSCERMLCSSACVSGCSSAGAAAASNCGTPDGGAPPLPNAGLVPLPEGPLLRLWLGWEEGGSSASEGLWPRADTPPLPIGSGDSGCSPESASCGAPSLHAQQLRRLKR